MISIRKRGSTSDGSMRAIGSLTLLALCVAWPGCAGPADDVASDRPAVETPPGGAAAPASPADAWPRWGGPDGDFKVAASGLADSWPDTGPPVVWNRELGAGYATIAADDGVLYTGYRDGDEDVFAALDADDGATIWEYRYEAPTREANMVQFGKGPNATPLIVGDRLVVLGYTGVLSAVDRAGGERIWSHELHDDFGADVLEFGFAASPIVHDGHVIVLVGGSQHGVVAFDPADGSVAWSGPAGSVSYATPIVIDVDGTSQLVYFSADEIVGLDPADGTRLWGHPAVNQYRNNASDPSWGPGNLLWVATQLDGGTRALRLAHDAEGTRVEQVWESGKMSIHHWNTLRLGDHVYASIGSNASILAGIDVRNGEILWRERGFEQVKFVHAGEQTVLLDGEGNLALADLSPEGLNVRSQVRIMESQTWTAPTLVGTRLYLRDNERIMALELGG